MVPRGEPAARGGVFSSYTLVIMLEKRYMTPIDGVAGYWLMNDDKSDRDRRKPKRPEEFSPAGSPGDDLLTRNLKRVYDEVASEPIPADWLKLLDQLDGKEGKDKLDG